VQRDARGAGGEPVANGVPDFLIDFAHQAIDAGARVVIVADPGMCDPDTILALADRADQTGAVVELAERYAGDPTLLRHQAELVQHLIATATILISQVGNVADAPGAALDMVRTVRALGQALCVTHCWDAAHAVVVRGMVGDKLFEGIATAAKAGQGQRIDALGFGRTVRIALRGDGSARPSDVPAILAMIRGLAEFERLAHLCVATESQLSHALFGQDSTVEVVVAWEGGETAGFALFFPNFSTFLGRPGLYLEDLFVRPEFRGRGYGRALLIHLARLAVQRGCGRFEWAVLDWNAPAIDFYQSLGATVLPDWRIVRVVGPALETMARGDPHPGGGIA